MNARICLGLVMGLSLMSGCGSEAPRPDAAKVIKTGSENGGESQRPETLHPKPRPTPGGPREKLEDKGTQEKEGNRP